MRTIIRVAFVLLFTCAATFAQPRKTENIILVTLDGLRTQELFGGADNALMNRDFGGVRDVNAMKKRFWRDTPEERRAALMPFFWNVVAKEGQVYGDRAKGSPVHVTNKLYFSYPGYNELLAGFADPKVDSNDKKYNENVTVLEYLNGLDRYKGKVFAYTCWDVFPFIINDKRSGIHVYPGVGDPFPQPRNDDQRAVNRLQAELPPVWPGVCFDFICFYPAIDALQQKKARVLYLGLGETDDWAHDKRYDCYLDAAHRADQYIEQLWKKAQSMPEYAGKTSLVITTDHGRGDNPGSWTGHGTKNKTSEFVWIAVLGPDTPALGVREKTEATQSQVAATIAHLLGEDFNKASEKSAKPLADAVK